MRTAAYICLLACLLCPLVNIKADKVTEDEPRVERLCDCGYREYTHWKDRPIEI